MPAETQRSAKVFMDCFVFFHLYENKRIFIFYLAAEKPANRKGDDAWSIATKEWVVTF